MNEKDQLIQALTPTLIAPRFEPFQRLETPGHRFVVASDGLWLEVRRAWLYALQRVARQSEVAMPYGVLKPELTFLYPPIPLELMQEFASLARRSCPQEAAVWLVWDEQKEEFSCRLGQVIAASAGHIRYWRPKLVEGEHLVMDLHSHGAGSAFFSSTDDQDDCGEVKVSGVLGRCDQPQLETAFRLCLLGKYISLKARVSGDYIEFDAVVVQQGEERWSTSFTRSC